MVKGKLLDKLWLTGRQSGSYIVGNREKERGCEIRDGFRNMQKKEKIREEIARFITDNKGQFAEKESLIAKRSGNGMVHNYRWRSSPKEGYSQNTK